MSRRPMAIYQDQPDGFRRLFTEFERRNLPFERIDPGAHTYDPAEPRSPYSLVFNRLSPYAFAQGGLRGMFFTLGYLANLERLGVPVVNGLSAFTYETSKARQLTLLQSLGLPYPRAVVINHADQAPAVAEEALRFPVRVRPNAGGADGQRFDTAEELNKAVAAGVIDLGADHTAIVQEIIPLRAGSFVRVETLGGRLLYAVKGKGPSAEVYAPPDNVVAACELAVQAAGIDVGGIEYGIDDRDGGLVYGDVSTCPNGIAALPESLRFDPVEKIVDFLERVAMAGRVPKPDHVRPILNPDAEYWDAAL